MGYQATTEVKVISPEISPILEADVICVTEGSIHTTVSQHLRMATSEKLALGRLESVIYRKHGQAYMSYFVQNLTFLG
ncbi:MAG TPA: hypothetical protein VMW53_10565 [archaeon]|jgi:hypothetical protein|nr:hypothetical protein [archaeon]